MNHILSSGYPRKKTFRAELVIMIFECIHFNVNLQFLNIEIIINTKVHLPSSKYDIKLAYLRILSFIAPKKHFNEFFSILTLYLMKDNPET